MLGSCIACTRALLNTKVGLKAILQTPNAIDILLDSLAHVNDISRAKGFELIAAMTLVSVEAREVALRAIQPRMSILVNHLQSEYTSTNVKVFVVVLAAVVVVVVVVGIRTAPLSAISD
jgi:hypothetical protein